MAVTALVGPGANNTGKIFTSIDGGDSWSQEGVIPSGELFDGDSIDDILNYQQRSPQVHILSDLRYVIAFNSTTTTKTICIGPNTNGNMCKFMIFYLDYKVNN